MPLLRRHPDQTLWLVIAVHLVMVVLHLIDRAGYIAVPHSTAYYVHNSAMWVIAHLVAVALLLSHRQSRAAGTIGAAISTMTLLTWSAIAIYVGLTTVRPVSLLVGLGPLIAGLLAAGLGDLWHAAAVRSRYRPLRSR